MSPGWKFFCAFFCVHLLASVTYYFLAGQPGSGMGPGAGRVGMPVFGGIMFLLSGGQPMATVSPLLFLLNSALTAGVATGIFAVVRRLRAA